MFIHIDRTGERRLYLHAPFSPPSTSFQGVGIVWQAVSATYIALVLCVVHNVAAELKENQREL
jgi:hypothetical protein